jgi:hypothetical protein
VLRAPCRAAPIKGSALNPEPLSSRPATGVCFQLPPPTGSRFFVCFPFPHTTSY